MLNFLCSFVNKRPKHKMEINVISAKQPNKAVPLYCFPYANPKKLSIIMHQLMCDKLLNMLPWYWGGDSTLVMKLRLAMLWRMEGLVSKETMVPRRW